MKSSFIFKYLARDRQHQKAEMLLFGIVSLRIGLETPVIA
jgi:hypothetical protein